MELLFSIIAEKQLKSLPQKIHKRIVEKLEWFANQKDPFRFAKPLVGRSAWFRFRIGNYRAIVTPEGKVLVVLQIHKRSEAYRKM